MSPRPDAGEQTIGINPQPWRSDHPRVLVEHPDEATGLEIASGLRYAGYAVGICPGPRGRAKCPLTGPAGCAPAHGADLVVCSLGYEPGAAREILRELRTRYPATPLLVEVPTDIDPELLELLDGCYRLQVNIVVMPGTHTYTLEVRQPGRYLWFCTLVCDEWAMEHPGYMSGYITVS